MNIAARLMHAASVHDHKAQTQTANGDAKVAAKNIDVVGGSGNGIAASKTLYSEMNGKEDINNVIIINNADTDGSNNHNHNENNKNDNGSSNDHTNNSRSRSNSSSNRRIRTSSTSNSGGGSSNSTKKSSDGERVIHANGGVIFCDEATYDDARSKFYFNEIPPVSYSVL